MQGKYYAILQQEIVKTSSGADIDTGLIIGDLKDKDSEVIVAKGGRGGRGNTAFKTQTNTAPDYSENGEEGEKKKRVLVDVSGQIGFSWYTNKEGVNIPQFTIFADRIVTRA